MGAAPEADPRSGTSDARQRQPAGSAAFGAGGAAAAAAAAASRAGPLHRVDLPGLLLDGAQRQPACQQIDIDRALGASSIPERNHHGRPRSPSPMAAR